MKTETKKEKHGAVVRKCNCNHEMQDKQYGKGMRLMNLCKDGAKARCTVCGTEH